MNWKEGFKRITVLLSVAFILGLVLFGYGTIIPKFREYKNCEIASSKWVADTSSSAPVDYTSKYADIQIFSRQVDNQKKWVEDGSPIDCENPKGEVWKWIGWVILAGSVPWIIFLALLYVAKGFIKKVIPHKPFPTI